MANEDYPLYVHWYSTLNWILDCAERLPKKVRFTIAARLSELSLRILERIIESIYRNERRELLRGINLDLEKLRILFRLCFDRRYLSAKQYEHICRALDEAGKMTGGWIRSL